MMIKPKIFHILNQTVILSFLFIIFSGLTYSQSNEIWDQVGEHLVAKSTYDNKYYWKDSLNWPIIDKNWKSVACKIRKSSKWGVMLNGRVGGMYAEVKHLQFSPDGDTLIYVGTKGVSHTFRRTISIRKFVEKDERLYDAIFPTLFSPDGKSWTYKIRDDEDWYLILDGKESQRYDFIDDYQFNPSGNMIVFKARNYGKTFIVINGFEGRQYDNIFDLTYNPKGNDVAYWAERDHKYFLVVGDSEINYSARRPPNPILYSPTGKLFLYCVSEIQDAHEKIFVIQNDIYSKPYDRVNWLETKFSPDGNSVAYPAGRGNDQFIVLNQKEEPYYEEVKSPIFSPDGFSLMYFAYESNKWFTVLNKRKGKRYDAVKEALFAPDAEIYSYAAKENNKWFVVQNDIEDEKKFDEVSSLTYNSKSDKFAYIAKTGETYKVVLNQTEGSDYRNISSLQFTPDGNLSVYIVRENDNKFVVINGSEQKKYKDIFKIEMSPDGKRIGYFALNEKNEIVWVVSE
jgi:hypothetical protein